MPWLKVDDKFHAHRKARKAGKAAIGIWVLAGSWCMDNPEHDGFVPRGVLRHWGGTKADADRLVASGLWHAEEHDGEPGWRFHDWHEFNPDYASIVAARDAEHAAKSVGGTIGNHRRWHQGRGVVVDTCEFCVPLREPPDGIGIGIADASDTESVTDRSGIADASDVHRPVPEPVPHTSPNGEVIRPGSQLAIVEAPREDVQSLCEHLADRIAEDGSKRPSIGKGWRDAARLMLDKDGRTEAEIHAAIDWCQNHHFWRSNVLSMPTLRDKFDQLRKVAASEQRQKPTRQQETDDMFDRAMQRAIAKEAR